MHATTNKAPEGYFAWSTEVTPDGKSIDVVSPVIQGETYYVDCLFPTEAAAWDAIAEYDEYEAE